MPKNLLPKSVATIATIFLSSFFSAHAAVQSVGNVTNVTLAADAANGNVTANFWIDNGGEAAVTAVAADVVRVRYYFTPLWSKEEPMIALPPGAWPTISNSVTFTDQGATYLIATPQLNVVVTKSPFKVDFQDKAGFYLLQDDHSEFDSSYGYTGQSGWTSGGYKLKCLKKLPAGQSFFGLGEYGGPLNRRGGEFECWNTGTYNWNEFNKPEYLNTPFFYGVQPANGTTNAFAYGIFFDNPCRPLFRFGTQSGTQYSFEAGDGQLDYFFFGGGTNHTMTAVMDRFSQLTGRPAMLPKWAFGYQLSRFSYLNQSWVQYLADTAISSNIPLDAVYLDIDYMNVNSDNNPTAANVLHQLTTDSNFPNPAGMVNYCGAKGVKIIPLIEPLLETQDPLYNEANTAAHFIKDNNSATVTGNIYLGPMSWFDFTSTPMQTWWQNKITNWMSAFPFAGIWNDINEPENSDGQIPSNGLLWCDGRYGTSNTDSRRQWSNEHNYFGLRCAATSYGALLKKNPDKRPFVLSRSGNCGLQHYAVSWSGDTAANWTYARTCIRFGTGAMISGAAWYGHDLGGFAGTVDGELLTRWHEWGALLPFYRNHSRKGDNVLPGGDQGREPWRFADPYQSAMRGSIQLRYKLMPYLYTLAYNCTQTGEPMNEPTVAKYFADNNTASLNDYEFLAGDLLVAPVYTQGATTRSVYLPYAPGLAWYHWWSNARYSGGQTVTVSAPLGQVPLFVRSGAILPMTAPAQNTAAPSAGYLDINCWPDGNSSFTLYEDEGDGWNYTNGIFASVTFTSARAGTNWDFNIGARQGGYNPGHTNFYLYCYNPDSVSAVKLNGSPLAQASSFNTLTSSNTAWAMTADGKLAIKLVDAGAAQNVHVDFTTNAATSSSAFGAMTVAGTFQNPPWNPAASNMVQTAAHIWQFDTTFVNGTNFQFKFAANGSWTTNWGENAGTQTQFTLPLTGTGKIFGGSNILVTGTFNGTYRFTFNDQTLAYSVVPLLASPYATMTVAGTFQNPPWSPSLTNMILVTNDQWQFDAVFPATTNVQFKFAANGTWTNNWGGSGQTQTNPPFSATGAGFGANISANVTNGVVYRFAFNDATLAYTLQPLAIIPARLSGSLAPGSQTCVLTFTNLPGVRFTVLGSTNLALPSSNWAVLGSTTETSSGQFQFADPLAGTLPQRFYRVRTP